MVTLKEILHTLENLELPPSGREYARRVASSPPSRRVGSRGGNVVTRFPSKKMGVTIQAESHRCELALVYVLEHDPNVIAFWDQPEPIKISYLSAKGRLVSPTTTPDYLVLKKAGLELLEVKPENALPELAKDKPNRFVQSDDGKWHSPPAETVVRALGIDYRIWTPAEVSPIWLRNIQHLQDYFGADPNLVPDKVKIQIGEVVQAELGISLAKLRQRCPTATADHLNFLIAHEELYVDLAVSPLVEPSRVRIFTCREAADTYALLHGPGYDNEPIQIERKTVVSNGTSQVIANRQLSAPALELLRSACPEDHAIANRRYKIITDPEFAIGNPTPERTVRRWRKSFCLAEACHGYGLLGLFPRFKDRGNHRQRFCDELLALVDKVIDEVYATPSRPNKRHTYDRLQLECERKGFPTPSYPWLNQRLSTRSKYKLIFSREGKRAAHKYEILRPGEPNDNHGAFPWDVCLTDHTLADVELICSETGENLGRPWMSVLFDGFSRRILTFYLTFDPPSYRTLMMLIRRCVEHHGHLPGTLGVDGGKEFQSVYFETLTAAYGITLRRRPPGKARFGSIIERMFGTLNTTFLHTLEGNTQNTRNIRQLTKSMNPKGHAVYTLEELHDMLSTFAFKIYDNRPHPTLNCSPAERYGKGIEISGARDHRSVVNDEVFRLMTLPTTSKGTAKIQPGMGVKIGGFYYWAQEMRNQRFEGKSVPVKYDPENIGVAWAYLGDQWLQCRPNGTLNLEGRTEKEMQLATLEWRRSHQLLGQRQLNSHLQLAEFLKSAECAKALRIQQAKDRALLRTRSLQPQTETVPSTPTGEFFVPTKFVYTPTFAKPKEESSPSSAREDYGEF